jgi:hypothetical protein
MELHKGTAANGIYLYQAKLAAGVHGYYFFAADDCGGCVTHPAYGYLRGPAVEPAVNAAPTLVDGQVDPVAGGTRAYYSYTVEYRDADADPAATATVYVNGTPHPMKLWYGLPHGGIYVYRTRHYVGEYHDYYFYFEDGRGGASRLPETGKYHGPVVTP